MAAFKPSGVTSLRSWMQFAFLGEYRSWNSTQLVFLAHTRLMNSADLWETNNAAEAKMARRGVDRLRHACGRTIAAAVGRRAQERPALGDFARDTEVGHEGIIAGLALASAGSSTVQHGLSTLCRSSYQSSVHFQTLPIVSWRP
jgi:hypothetical protein